jgi:aquaporin Z
MQEKLIVETIGTFLLTSVILHSSVDNKIGYFGIAATLFVAILIGASVSGAHYNPAVTFAMILENKIAFSLGILYILSQLIGAFAAVKFNSYVLNTNTI